MIKKNVYRATCEYELTPLGKEKLPSKLGYSYACPSFEIMADGFKQAINYIYDNWDDIKSTYSTDYVTITALKSIEIQSRNVYVDCSYED